MALGSSGPPKWFIAFCILFGLSVGFVTAAIAASLLSVAVGEENRAVFILIWLVAAVIFFAWPMHIVERARAVRRQRAILRERIGDLDYEPPAFPMLGTRARGPKPDEIEIKAPDIGAGRLRTFLSRGRTAEQRMADHLKSLELKSEMQRARGSKSQDKKGSDTPD